MAGVAALVASAGASAQPDSSRVTWDVRDVDHPVMGAITVAVPQNGFTTQAAGAKIVSAAFVSCEKATRTIALELANSVESDTRGGLKPVEMPRLLCNGRANGMAVRTEVAARWTTNELGDALARGLPPAELRRCGTIEVQQHVTMPAGSASASQRIAITLAPGEGGLATVFSACSEAPAVNAAAEVTPKPAPVIASPAAPARPSAASASGWKSARTVTDTKTNVRAAPRINGALVTQLHPGTPVLAQKAEGDWWRVRPHKGTGFSGFIRGDRLAFE